MTWVCFLCGKHHESFINAYICCDKKLQSLYLEAIKWSLDTGYIELLVHHYHDEAAKQLCRAWLAEKIPENFFIFEYIVEKMIYAVEKSPEKLTSMNSMG